MDDATTRGKTPPRSADPIGQTIDDRYRVEGLIGKGGMATVYRAVDLKMGNRVVVLKMPHAHLMSEPDMVKRFGEEMRQLATLDHPNIVKIHDTGVWNNVPYIVQQYLGGGSLKDKLEKEPRQEPRMILSWLRPVSKALDYMHDVHQVIHRDVKPSNILYDDHGAVFLADFGIAKAMKQGIEDDESHTRSLTRADVMPGSARYMAPEATSGKYGPAYDQYSLAVIVYQALAGQAPHKGETTWELMFQKKNVSASPLGEHCPDLPAEATAAVMTALKREPDDRHSSCSAFMKAFAKPFRVSRQGGTDPNRAEADVEMPAEGAGSVGDTMLVGRKGKSGQRLVDGWPDGAAETTERPKTSGVDGEATTLSPRNKGGTGDGGVRIRKSYVLLGVGLLLFLLLGLWLKSVIDGGEVPPQSTSVAIVSPDPSAPAVTLLDRIPVAVRLDFEGARVAVDGRDLIRAPDGLFKGEAAVSTDRDGPQVMRLEATLPGGARKVIEFTVVRDTTPPKILIDSPKAHVTVVEKADQRIIGKLEELNPKEFTAEGGKLTSGAGGKFTVAVDVPKGKAVTVKLRAKDAAGNEATEERRFTWDDDSGLGRAPDRRGAIVLRSGIPLKVITRRMTSLYPEANADGKGIPIPAFTTLYVLPPSPDTEDRRLEKMGEANRKLNGFFRVAGMPTEPEKGWLHEKDVIEWTHREAVQFTPLAARVRAQFWESSDLARRAFEGSIDLGPPLALEPARPGRTRMLLPILDSETVSAGGKNVPLHRIAFLASRQAAPPVKTASGDVVDEEYVRKNSTADVVFVIDTTDSMGKPIAMVKEAVRKVAQALRAESDKGLGVRLRFGLVAFRDSGAKDEYVTRTYCTLPQGADLKVFEEKLAELRVGGGGDLAEDVIAGLVDALSPKMGWNEVGWKHVVLIGDASAKERDHPVETSRVNRDGLTIEDVKRKAQPNQDASAESLMRIIQLDAVHVFSPILGYGPDNEVADKQFRSLRDVRPFTGWFKSARGGADGEDFSPALSQWLIDSLKNFMKAVRQGGQIPGAPPGVTPVGTGYSDPSMPYPVLELIRSLGKEDTSDVTPFQAAWSPELDARGDRVLVPHILVVWNDLSYFATALKLLLTSIENNRDSNQGLEGLVGQLKVITASVTTGEAFTSDTSLDSVFEGFLKVPLKSDIFKMSLRQLRGMSDSDYNSWLRKAKEKERQLQEFLASPDTWFLLLEDGKGSGKMESKHAYIQLTDLP